MNKIIWISAVFIPIIVSIIIILPLVYSIVFNSDFYLDGEVTPNATFLGHNWNCEAFGVHVTCSALSLNQTHIDHLSQWGSTWQCKYWNDTFVECLRTGKA